MTGKGGEVSTSLPDLVYVVRSGENEELRYSLRSVDRYAKGLFGDVWVVGTGLPDWLTGVRVIPVRDGSDKHETMRRKILAACREQGVSDTFLLMNDDYFLTRKIDRFETYHMGPAREWIDQNLKLRKGQWSPYLRDVDLTVRWLARKGHDVMVRETHSPTWWEKRSLARWLVDYPAARPITVVDLWDVCGVGPDGGRVINAKVHFDDNFERWKADGSNPWVSSSDVSWHGTKVGIDVKSMFRRKSRFEK